VIVNPTDLEEEGKCTFLERFALRENSLVSARSCECPAPLRKLSGKWRRISSSRCPMRNPEEGSSWHTRLGAINMHFTAASLSRLPPDCYALSERETPDRSVIHYMEKGSTRAISSRRKPSPWRNLIPPTPLLQMRGFRDSAFPGYYPLIAEGTNQSARRMGRQASYIPSISADRWINWNGRNRGFIPLSSHTFPPIPVRDHEKRIGAWR